ncbi:MAG: cob(I)yrinic acid a,c-diamide adenosyltransferase [Prevotellaceae bacterium]|jgi:cob(I)alamin adenosyltransferase|nr:cob(I)yrinic acid a,c-diamide adenosyltransferase [Prevotellaceae bacterium]
MKVYTKKGDKGTTSLIGGTRVPKYHIRVEAYGTVDELISYIGLIRSQKIDLHIIETLHQIQIKLMDIAAIMASDEKAKKLRHVSDSDIQTVENEIDRYDAELEPLKYFVLPGGHEVTAFCHIARCICRRAERMILRVNEESAVPENVLIYINRLSDYLFMLARKLHKNLDIQEIFWITDR